MILLFALAGLLLTAGGVPLTKKDVGSSGYDYKPPPTSYGVPSGSVGASSQDYRISTSAPFAPGAGVGFEATTAAPLPTGLPAAGLQRQSYVTSTVSPLLYSQGFQLPIHDFGQFNAGGGGGIDVGQFNAAQFNAGGGGGGGIGVGQFNAAQFNAGGGGGLGSLGGIGGIDAGQFNTGGGGIGGLGAGQFNAGGGGIPSIGVNQFNAGGGVQDLGSAPLDGNAFAGLVFDQSGGFGQQINPQLVSIGINGNQGLLNAQNVPTSVFAPGGGVQSGNLQNRYNVDEITQGDEDGVEPDIEVSRHLYFFSSTDDIQAPRQRINLPNAPKKQNLKVLFIKAPAVVTPPPVVIPAQKQNEEKTVVYVLVKKPEEPTPIEIETPPTTPPSKPEVFFIKYNTQQEAEEAVDKIQRQQKEQNNAEVPELLSSRFSQEGVVSTVDTNQGPSFINLAGTLTTTVSPLQFAALAQVGPFTQETGSSEAPQVAFNSPSLYSSTVLSGGEQHVSDGLPSTSTTASVETDNVKALSESFGGPGGSSGFDSDASNSVDVSATKLGGPTSDEVTPHSTYGVPDKRFARLPFRPAPFKRGVTRFRF